MSDLSPSASVAKLLESPEDQLYQELGIRARAIAADPSLSGSFEPNVIHDAKLMGPLDDIKDLGRRIFRRWNREAYDLICGGDPVDEKDREKVRNSFGLGDAAVAGSIYTFAHRLLRCCAHHRDSHCSPDHQALLPTGLRGDLQRLERETRS